MTRRNDIDFLKGIAIIAVVLYHVGMLPFGFLGVEVFLAISGFLLIPKLVDSISAGDFHYFPWVFGRLYRIWPITLVASTVCLIAGYFLMFPDGYENLAESVVASNLFSQNILSALTTKDYWNSANEFKPLMQMWYLGILAQFYVIFPLLLCVLHKCIGKFLPNGWGIFSVVLLGVVSLGLYLLDETPFTLKYYFIQYRIWEFALGGAVGLFVFKSESGASKYLFVVAVLVMLGLLCYDFTPLSEINNVSIVGAPNMLSTLYSKMIGTVCMTFIAGFALMSRINIRKGMVCKLGVISLSIFVWHQVILAFLRISVLESFNIVALVLYMAGALAVGYVSYKFVESIRITSGRGKIIFYSLLIIVTAAAFMLYRNAGVVRDVPELGVSLDNPQANRNTTYIDQFYKLDRDFTTDKRHVLVVGNSFARDFIGVLTEYRKSDSLEISYKPYIGGMSDNRMEDADYIFFFGAKTDLPKDVLKRIEGKPHVYGISTKYFGRDFGIYYNKRFSPDYFRQTISANALCDSVNRRWERTWGRGNFIDMMETVKKDDGTIPLFTDTRKVISFDCRHLTRYGCAYYATLLPLDSIFALP